MASSPASPSSANAVAPETPPPIGFEVKTSDVVVTGAIDDSRDPRPRAGDAKPGSTVEVVRFTCEMTRDREEATKIVCKAASGAPFGPAGAELERRMSECFVVSSRAATATEVATMNRYLASEGGRLTVPTGKLFAVERHSVFRQEVLEYVDCPKNVQERHPCDPFVRHTGRFVEKPVVDVYAFAPNGRQVFAPYPLWKLRWIELTRMPGALDTIDLSTQPPGVRAALAYDRAVEAVRSKDKKRVAAAVKEVDANVTIADGTRIEDMRVPRSVADVILQDLPIIRAVAEGRATVGDACTRM